ncbi:MAG TPA: ADOP family duplicated permease [Vicinamibacterales bacterium]|nr:ADOP family duplicated permease [Vicinamibacterales bacterium]
MRLPRRRRPDEDFAAEVDAHIALEADRLIADGMAPAEARAAAARAFGNAAAARERFYETNRWMWLDHFVRDLRYGARALRQSPAFLVTTVLTLAVGLGLVTVVFTVFNAYVLRPFAVRDPATLYRIAWRAPDAGGQNFAWRDYEALRERTDIFSAMVAEHNRFVSSVGRPIAAAFVSANYFDVLGPEMLDGRPLRAADAHAYSVVLSHQAWTRLFAADRRALGSEVELDGRPFTVVGIMGPRFTGLDDYPLDVWAPQSTYADMRPIAPGSPEPRRAEITVRFQPGVTIAHAEAALTPFVSSRMGALTKTPSAVRAEMRPNSTPNPLSVETLAVLSPVFAAFVLVLVTACANVSNVMLARAVGRQREIAVRLSLGATRRRVVAQLLTEGLLVAALAGAAALALAAWLLRAGVVALFSTLPPSLAALMRVVPLSFDYRVFGFALAVAAVATLMFALVPALQASRQRLTDAMHGQRSGTRTASRLRGALVIAQVAVSLLLVVIALTLARNFTSLGAIDLGYDTRGVYSINVRGEQGSQLARVADVLSLDPRVAELAVTGGNPMFVQSRNVAARPRSPLPDGEPSRSGAVPTRYTFVSPEYFTILRIPIVQGRSFTREEARGAAPVAVVSAAAARTFWPNANPIGQTIAIERANGRRVEEIPGYTEATVVGVAADVVSGLLVDGKDASHMYLPTHARHEQASALLIRPRAAGELRLDALQELFRRTGADPETFEAIPLDEMRQAQVYPLRAAAWIGGLLGGIALVLSISGLYGVLSYTLSQRTREIGIRMALGATAGAVIGLVMRQSVRLAGVGALAGTAIAFATLKFLGSLVQLKEVSLLNAAPFAIALALVLLATVLAAYQPARRATRVDPAETLRAEA